MRRIFRIIVVVLAVATGILAIAMAYVYGMAAGVHSRRWCLYGLDECRNPNLKTDYLAWTHPLMQPLQNIAFILGICRIAIEVIALGEKKKKVKF
jgi:hypothetical protein